MVYDAAPSNIVSSQHTRCLIRAWDGRPQSDAQSGFADSVHCAASANSASRLSLSELMVMPFSAHYLSPVSPASCRCRRVG
jgi:hypothetical protein